MAADPIALSAACCRVLTLVGSIFLAMKLALFDYKSVGAGAVTAGTMIALSLIALWVESVVPYVLTAARLEADVEMGTVRGDRALSGRDILKDSSSAPSSSAPAGKLVESQTLLISSVSTSK